MVMTDSISKGDRVTVRWEYIPVLHDVEVLYLPAATGDCFVLKDKNGNIYNVQTYAVMEKIVEDGDVKF